jgi:hypothetical protein
MVGGGVRCGHGHDRPRWLRDSITLPTAGVVDRFAHQGIARTENITPAERGEGFFVPAETAVSIGLRGGFGSAAVGSEIGTKTRLSVLDVLERSI